jgi:hypothetical protein
MAVKNHPNLLKKIVDIQNITLRYKALGLSQKEIFIRHIEPVYCISDRTYSRYLAHPAKKLLKKHNENEK